MQGFYDRSKLFWKDIDDTTLVAACAPPGTAAHMSYCIVSLQLAVAYSEAGLSVSALSYSAAMTGLSSHLPVATFSLDSLPPVQFLRPCIL